MIIVGYWSINLFVFTLKSIPWYSCLSCAQVMKIKQGMGCKMHQLEQKKSQPSQASLNTEITEQDSVHLYVILFSKLNLLKIFLKESLSMFLTDFFSFPFFFIAFPHPPIMGWGVCLLQFWTFGRIRICRKVILC